MARLNIDTGTLGNPATGDTLRTAMTKINTNFEELYLSLLQTDDQGGFITTNVTNGDIRVQPNGAGIIEIDKLKITDDDITSLVTNGNVAITGNGTGGVTIEGITFNGTELSSDDSTQVTIKENLNVTGTITGDGSGLTNVGGGAISTIDADSTTVSNLEVDNFKASAIVIESEGITSNDNDTTLPTSAAIKDYVDAEDANIASDSMTFTNKSGNISQWTNDSNYATQAYVDARDIGDLSVTGSTISAPSNADLRLDASGTGNVTVASPFVLTSLTTTERDALTAVNGMMIYNTTSNQIEAYENGAWVSLRGDTADAG